MAGEKGQQITNDSLAWCPPCEAQIGKASRTLKPDNL